MFHLFQYLRKKDWFAIAIAFCLIVFQVFLELKMPDYTKNLTTIVNSGGADMGEVWKNGGMMLACAFGSMCGAFVCSWFISRTSAHFSMTLREELFRRITSFSHKEMNRFSTPSLITRTTNDVVNMQMFMSMGMQMLMKAPITAIWAISKIRSSGTEWTVAMAVCIGIILVLVATLVSLCLPRFRRIQKLTDALNDATRENVAGVRVIRAFNAEARQEARFEKVNEEITANHLFTSRAMGLMMPMMTICMNGLTLAIYWIGAVLINRVTYTSILNMAGAVNQRVAVIADMTAFTSYALQVVMAFMMLIAIFIILPRTMVSGNRIWEVLAQESSIVDGPGAHPEQTGTLEFRNVGFAYAQDGGETLTDISFRVEQGETVAIIGATGSGKTTLVDLIPRFYDATAGQILVDGVDVREYSLEDLRSRISLAAQRASLFRGTIRENVAYGCSRPDEARVQEALALAHADFVDELDKGLDSEVAQGGTNFSGGQKQRLSIARALYRKAEIMIFDDTFSALDYKTDLQVRQGIREKLQGTTVLIVAQRIGTIRNADRILVLEDGRIVGMGRHSELLASCPVYRQIALSQLSEEEL